MMQPDKLSPTEADRELYDKVKRNELSLEELSIPEIIRLTYFINSEIDKKLFRLRMLYEDQNKK